MALSATVYHLQVELSDVDRGVYEALDLRVARHPSETMRYLLARVIGYCLCYEPGIAFSKGLSSTDEPAVWARDMQGSLRLWLEVGTLLRSASTKRARPRPRWWCSPTATSRRCRRGARAKPFTRPRASRSTRSTARSWTRSTRPPTERALVAGSHRGDAVRDERRGQPRDPIVRQGLGE